MARKNGFGKMLVIGAAAAIAGGVVSYLRRKEIEDAVQEITDALDAREEDGFFSADLGDEPVFHKIPTDGEAAPGETAEEAAPEEAAPAAGENGFAEEPAPEAE